MLPSILGPYRKLLVALGMSLVVALDMAFGVDSEASRIAISLLTAFGVWAVPNDDS